MSAYLSRAAEIDLERIFEQINEKSTQNAVEFLDRVDAALAVIAANPRLARERDELPVGALRIVRATPAMMIYRVLTNDDAEVVRIAHEHQDIPALIAKLSSDETPRA